MAKKPKKPQPATRLRIIAKMRKLGVYRAEFDGAIDRYVALRVEYDTIYKRYAEEGYCCTVRGAAGDKKNPEVSTLEALRRDILALETSLGLTPQGLLKLKEDAFAKPKEKPAWTEQLG